MQEARDRVVQAQGDKQQRLCKTTVTGELSLELVSPCHPGRLFRPRPRAWKKMKRLEAAGAKWVD